MSTIHHTAAHGYSVGDVITFEPRLSWWQRLWWRIRHLTWKYPPPKEYVITVIGSNSFEVEDV